MFVKKTKFTECGHKETEFTECGCKKTKFTECGRKTGVQRIWSKKDEVYRM